MKLASLVAFALLAACGDGAVEPPAPDAPGEPPPSCTEEPRVERAAFVDASVAYLRTVFATTTGFDGGAVAYGEGWVPLNDGGCPIADWTALSYVATVDQALVPAELRGTHDRVAAVWTLAGRRFVVFLPAGTTADASPWITGRLPDNVVATVRAGASQSELDAVIARIAAAGTVRVTFLDAVGILSLELAIGTFADDTLAPGATVAAIDAAAAELRASDLFDAIEWSGLNFRIPNSFFAAAAVDTAALAPECLRTRSRNLRDRHAFTTRPSLAAPLGAGPVMQNASCF